MWTMWWCKKSDQEQTEIKCCVAIYFILCLFFYFCVCTAYKGCSSKDWGSGKVGNHKKRGFKSWICSLSMIFQLFSLLTLTKRFSVRSQVYLIQWLIVVRCYDKFSSHQDRWLVAKITGHMWQIHWTQN